MDRIFLLMRGKSEGFYIIHSYLLNLLQLYVIHIAVHLVANVHVNYLCRVTFDLSQFYSQ